MSERGAYVIDASALLVFLKAEAGADRVGEALAAGATMSAANWAEVLSKMADAGQEPEEVAKQLRDMGILGSALVIEPFDSELAVRAARLRALTKTVGLSLGDRACLALGQRLGRPVLTADRMWAKLKISGVKVEPIR